MDFNLYAFCLSMFVFNSKLSPPKIQWRAHGGRLDHFSGNIVKFAMEGAWRADSSRPPALHKKKVAAPYLRILTLDLSSMIDESH